MKKTILLFVLAMLIAALMPTSALAYTDIPVTGDWTCEYEVLDSGVSGGGGTGTLRLFVKNTADSRSTDIIHYVQINYAAGRDSEAFMTKRVTIAPTRDAILDFTFPIAEADAGVGMQLWVAMSTRDADDVDGIGVVNNITFGPDPVYDSSFEISTGASTINRGDTIKIGYGGSKIGNKPVDIKVYDHNDTLLLSTDNMDVLFIGFEDYTPTSTTTYQFTCKIYKPGTDTLVKEILSSSITVTVIQPTPEPAEETPTPEPAEETPTPAPVEESTPEPIQELESTPKPSEEVAVAEESDTPIVMDSSGDSADIGDTDSLFSSRNTLFIIVIILLLMTCFLVVGLMVYIMKNNKTKS